MVEALHTMEGDTWQDKWDKAIEKGVLVGSTKKTSPGITHDGNEQSTQKANITYSSEKRKYLEPKQIVTQTKKSKSNEHSLLVRIDKNTKVTKSVPLQDGQGICINDSRNICVLDVGKGIQIYNENLHHIRAIPLKNNGNGIGLSFNQNQYYIPFSTNTVEIYDGFINKWKKMKVIDPISVRVNNTFIYILCKDRFEIHYKSLHGILPHKAVNMNALSDVKFSDFIIYDNVLLFIDSFGDIYQFDLEAEVFTHPENKSQEYRNSSMKMSFCR